MTVTVSLNSKHNEVIKKLRNACPPHRIHDIEALVKQYKGDEIKISHVIQEWWEEEPEKSQEAEWQDVNKKAVKKDRYNTPNHHYRSNSRGERGGERGERGDRGDRESRYRSYGGRGGGLNGRGGMSGGRGSGAERRHNRDREYHKRDRDRSKNNNPQAPTSSTADAENLEKSKGIPTPVRTVAPPKGAWGSNTSSLVNAATPADSGELNLDPVLRPDVGSVTAQDPTPAGFLEPTKSSKLEARLPPSEDGFGPLSAAPGSVPTPAPPTGNVWATKGSAHLIQQEKIQQKPPLSARHVRPPPPPTSSQHAPPTHAHMDSDILGETSSNTNNPAAPTSSLPVMDSHDSKDVNVAPSNDISPPIPTVSETLELDATLESLLPASVNGANVNATGWSPRTDPEGPTTIPITDLPLGIEPETSLPSEPDPVRLDDRVDLSLAGAEVEPPAAPPANALPSSTVLLGAWDVSAGDDAGLDFGFGSFGNENDVASVEDAPPNPSRTSSSLDPTLSSSSTAPKPISTATTAMSPARPPPGLSIGGMPPMPANAVHVQELENKLESVSLGVTSEDATQVEGASSSAPLTSANGVTGNLSEKKGPNDLTDTGQTTQANPPHLTSSTTNTATTTTNTHVDSNPMLANQSYGAAAYGMGIYNYNGAANVTNGFMGIHGPNAQVLGGVLPQQHSHSQPPPAPKLPQPTNGTQPQGSTHSQAGGGIPQHLHQQPSPSGIYGTQSSTVNGIGAVNNSAESSQQSIADAPTSTSAGIPPGMPGAMPYNPAMFYGQQYYQMGQPHGGVGYSHGYGQFGAGVQSGFGYQQVMQQSSGYGQPYEDPSSQQHHGSHTSHHSTTPHQSYQKNVPGGSGSGGYRTRNHQGNSHHGSHTSGGHQYQNQYNPQHGGYGAQPYNMGYGVDQFGNRSGYVPGSMDPYAMQQSNAGYQSNAGHSSSVGGGFHQEDADHSISQKNGGKSKGGTSRGSGGSNNGFSTGNPTMPQYPQIPPPQQAQTQQQQGFGFQGGTETSSAGTAGGASSNNGWSNQGWSGSTWQGSN